MATEKGIALALGILAESFPTREITERTGDVWAQLFSDVSDDALGKAVVRLCKDPQRKFFPSTGEVFGAIAAIAPPIDSVQILHRIAQLGHYDVHRGWVYPTPKEIRDALGDEIADAYTSVGRETLYSEEPVTQNIAQRAFTDSLEKAQARRPERPLLPPAESSPLPEIASPPERPPRQLNPGTPTPLKGVVSKVMQEIEQEQSA